MCNLLPKSLASVIQHTLLCSIKSKITFFALSFFLVSIWSLSFYATTSLRKDMEKTFEEQQFATATIYAQQIEEGLKIRIEALEQTANQVSVIMEEKPQILDSFLDNQLVLKMLFNGTLSIQNTDALAIASWPLSLGITGTNYSDRDYVLGALHNGKPSIGHLVIGRRLKKPSISMGVPIRNKNQQIVGALTGTIALGSTNFLDSISEIGYGKNGNYFLVSPNQRRIITSSQKERIMAKLPDKDVIPAIDVFLEGYEGSAIYTNQYGVEVITSVKNISISGWKMAISMPTKDAFSPIDKMRHRIMFATFLLTICMGILFWWILKRQLSPIVDTIKSLELMTIQKNFLKPLNIKKQDEIGKLIDSFNMLLDALAKQKDELQKEITKNNTIQTQLYQTAKEAEIGKIVANISHQWRGSLAKVGAVNLLTLTQIKNNYPLQRNFLTMQSEEIAKQLDFMSQTMQDFLEFYKPSKTIEEFSISETIQRALHILEKSIHDSSLTIEYNKITDKKIVGIKNRWIHIWLNLINNTITAGDRNGISNHTKLIS
jgi:signal transduction histidine kinase